MDWNWLLVIAGAALILIEVAFGGFAGFDLVLIGSSFVIGGGLGLLFGNTTAGLVTASVLCLFYIVAGRGWVRRRMHATGAASNVDALIGRHGVVLQRIARHAPGQVRVNDEVWRAEAAPGAGDGFEPGTEVTVAGVHGVTLQVR